MMSHSTPAAVMELFRLYKEQVMQTQFATQKFLGVVAHFEKQFIGYAATDETAGKCCVCMCV